MLIELSVRNLAIFRDVRVPCAPRLNIVTGETGAGKSILVEAVRLALGERADPTAVKSGEAEAEVSARFDLAGRADLREAWEEAGFPWGEGRGLRRGVPPGAGRRAVGGGRFFEIGAGGGGDARPLPAGLLPPADRGGGGVARGERARA